MDIFGLGKAWSSAIVVAAILAALWGIKLSVEEWVETGKEEAVEADRRDAAIQSSKDEIERVKTQSEAASKELQVLHKKLEEVHSSSNKLRSLMQRNWTDELQANPSDFTNRANSATDKQLLRAQATLDKVYSSASGMP